MRCTRPRTVGFYSDGKTLCWSKNKYSKEFPVFQLPCGKCISCRLEYSRQWAVRCMHEAQMHEENCFVTLTYSDENLKSDRLIYSDFQKFMKRLRKAYPNLTIGCFVTGEYGEEKKRPHWHAILFGFRPSDAVYKYSNERGDKVFSSNSLDKIWSHGMSEFGSVTFESAGYCARYAAKKLVHGYDGSHDYHPISKKSSKHAIGKKFLEVHWRSIFHNGYCVLEKSDGSFFQCGIPRYYEKWLQKEYPADWRTYVTKVKYDFTLKASLRQMKEDSEYRKSVLKYGYQVSRNEARELILKQKFNNLQNFLKL